MPYTFMMLLNLLRQQFNIENISLLMCLFITFHNYQLKVVYHMIIYSLTFRIIGTFQKCATVVSSGRLSG